MDQGIINKPRNIIKRVKWRSVGIVILAAFLLFLVFIGFNPFISYKGSGDIKIKSWADPGSVGLSDKSTIWIEVMNRGEEKKWIFLSLKSYSPVITFLENNGQEANETMSLGRGESRRIDFKVQVSAEYGGNYGVEVDARYDREQIDDEVYIGVNK